MMHDMMNMMEGMTWGMGLISLLVLIPLVAALAKYVFSK
jgi:hypothetical protein